MSKILISALLKIKGCNGQQKQDANSGSVSKKNPLEFEWGRWPGDRYPGYSPFGRFVNFMIMRMTKGAGKTTAVVEFTEKDQAAG